MIDIIFWAIFLISIVGMGIILIKKIPVLAELSVDNDYSFLNKKKRVLLKKINSVVNKKRKIFSGEIILQKILSKIRITSLKIENKTNSWLYKLRRKSLRKKESKLSDEYWEKIKEEKDRKKKKTIRNT